MERSNEFNLKRSWMIPLLWVLGVATLGFGAQLCMSLALWERLLFEDIAETIRNPFWISHRRIYDGISSNVVYYKLVDLYYQVRGFDVFVAKELRLILSAISAAAVGYLCWIHHRTGGLVVTLVSAQAFLLSPTLIYFGVSQAPFGFELQIAPILGCLWVHSCNARGRNASFLLLLAAAITATGAACFPPVLFFIPAVLIVDLLYGWVISRDWVTVWQRAMRRFMVMGIGFGCALAVPFLLVENPALLFYDPAVGSGLFRGGGGSISPNPLVFAGSVWQTITDLFVAGSSYHFNLSNVEFGTNLARVVFLLTLGGLAGMLWSRYRRMRAGQEFNCIDTDLLIVVFALTTFITVLVLAHISPSLPGIRRASVWLISFYLLYYVAVKWYWKRRKSQRGWLAWLACWAMMLLPMSHLWQYSLNRTEQALSVKDAYPRWLRLDADARISLELLYAEVLAGTQLDCSLAHRCRYSALYAALQLVHRGRHESSGRSKLLPVYAEDPVSGDTLVIEFGLWETYYWAH